MIAAVGLRAGVTGDPRPPLSWRLQSDEPGFAQQAYRLQVRSDEFEVASDQCLFVPWPANPLKSRERVQWRVQVRTNHAWTDWSQPAVVEAALLSPSDWVARFVTADEPGERSACPILRRDFDVAAEPRRARLYVTALGMFEARLNGERVGRDFLTPGWTSYDHRVAYLTYDVSDLVRRGDNTFEAMLGDGWYRGWLGWTQARRRDVYGSRRALLAQLEVDGRVVVATDESWQAASSEWLSADIYDGAERGPAASRRRPVRVVERDLSTLHSTEVPPARVTQVVRPAATWGAQIIDFGQNLVGWVRLRVHGPEGARVEVRHAEVLEHDGTLHTSSLRTAKATDTYVLRGNGAERRAGGIREREDTLEPKFTFHGFRYAQIAAPASVEVLDAEAVVVHSDLERIGSFACSDARLNRLHENVVWGLRGNFVSIPTDCPQRDERLGWTGDAQVFAEAACFLYDCRAFFSSWLADLAAEQRDDGAVPIVVPNVLGESSAGIAGWSDAATVVPWTVYEAYGDPGVLRRQYASMKAWVDWVAGRTDEDGAWTSGFQLGDWLDPDAPPDKPGSAKVDRHFVATAYLSRSAGLLARAAEVLGESHDADAYAVLRARAASAAWSRWAGELVRSQAGCAIALQFGIAPETERARVAQALAELVRNNAYRIGTGFLGTPVLLPALSENGYLDDAYGVLLCDECPSWLYQVKQGATTMWERWDAITPDGQIHVSGRAPGGGMLSFNHYAYGAVAAWMYRTIAGLEPLEPGYRRVRIAPRPGGGITWARATLRSPYGPTSVSWRMHDGAFTLEVILPPGTTGLVDIGDTRTEGLASGTYRLTHPLAVRDA